VKKKVLKTSCKGSLLSQKKASTQSQTPLADAMQLQEPKTERVSFSAILDRLKAANNTGEAVPLSPMEVCEVYHKLQSLETCASELPITVQNNCRQFPFEILEFTMGPRAKGSESAEISRRGKYLEVFNLRAGQYLQQIFSLLNGPSGVEEQAADHILRFMQEIEGRLREISQVATPEFQVGAKSAFAALAAIKKAFSAKIETHRKAVQRAKKYKGRKIKRHTPEFSGKCNLLVFNIIQKHFDWLEDSKSPRPQFSLLKDSVMPEKEFGSDLSGRQQWEKWIYSYLEDQIFRKKSEGEEMASLWSSHRSHLKNKVVPSYWGHAGRWKEIWKIQQIEKE